MQSKAQPDWSVFDAIYLINLRERTDRRRELEAELCSVGLLPGDPKLSWQDAVRPSAAGGFPSVGAHGCFLSHLACLRAASVSKHTRILILEDDACFPQTEVSRLQDALTRLKNSEWQIWYGGHLFVGADQPLSHGWGIPIASNIGIQTAHCIGLNGAATINSIASLLELILTRPPGHVEAGPMHVDGAYSTWRAFNDHAITLATIPTICRQRPSRSDIATLRMLDRHPITRHLMTPLRRLRNYMRTIGSGR
jgi:glycosyl transferase, family 25